MRETNRQILIRKLLHLGLLVPLGGYWYVFMQYSPSAAIYVLLGTLLGGLVYEFLRLETSITLPFSTYTKHKERTYHVDGINLVLSMMVLHTVFVPAVALSVSLVAIIGDVVSALGRMYGRISLGEHILQHGEGLLVTFVVDLGIFIFILGPMWYVGLLAGVAVMIENILTTFDDNLVVPIVVGTLAQIMIAI